MAQAAAAIEARGEYYLNPAADTAADLSICRFIGGFLAKVRRRGYWDCHPPRWSVLKQY